MSKSRTIKVDIVSDVMCPWCYIGQKNLDTALEKSEDIRLEIFWRPYQLDATLPREGKGRQTYLSDKFGGEEKAAAIYKRIEDAGQHAGIDFNFDRISVSPNTLDAHRLIRWAGGISRDTQDNVVRRLFAGFFEHGRHIGDHAVLIDIAKACGMDPKLVGELLASDKDKQNVETEISHAQQMGITGVPCFILDDKFAVMGAQPPDALVQAFAQTLSDKPDQS